MLLIQDSAARVLTNTKKAEHKTPVLKIGSTDCLCGKELGLVLGQNALQIDL